MEANWAALSTDVDDVPAGAPGHYQRHRPDQTLLYRVIAQHYPAFLARLDAEGRTLPLFVRLEFEAYFKCGLLEHGFMRVKGVIYQPAPNTSPNQRRRHVHLIDPTVSIATRDGQYTHNGTIECRHGDALRRQKLVGYPSAKI
jgi:hypothetical protein